MNVPETQRLVEWAIDGSIDELLSLLAAHPTLATAAFDAALVTGESEAAGRYLREDATLTSRRFSRRNLPPLILCLRSVLVSPKVPAGGARRDFAGCIRLLVGGGCDVNQKVPFDPPWDSSSGTPLYWAAGYHGQRDLARVLLELGATPNDGETLYHAVEQSDPALMRLLHPHNTSLAEWSYAFLHLMDYEDLATAECMLQLGVDLNHRHPQTGETPLHWAVKHSRSSEMIGLLCRFGADPAAPDGGGVGAYARAARSGDLAATQAMERAGHAAPLDPVSALMLAASQNDAAAVDRILARHPCVRSEVSVHDHNALHRAAAAGRSTAVAGLLRLAGIDPRTPDASGATPLHYASLHGHTETVRVLIEAGAPLDTPDRTHKALPIGWACWASLTPPFSRNEDALCRVVRLLLDAGSPKPPGASASPRLRELLG